MEKWDSGIALDNETLKKVNCKQAARLMSVRRDRTLSIDEADSLKQHLYVCINCQRFDKQLNFLSQLSKKYAQGAAVPATASIKADPDTEGDKT